MLMAQGARIDDGYFDIVATDPMSRKDLLMALPKIFKGSHTRLPAVRFCTARKARVTTWPSKSLLPDGEIFGKTPTTIRIHPKHVRYFS